MKLSGFVVTLLSATTAAAAMAQPVVVAAAGNDSGLTDIIVTAQRRTQSAQDVGVAISVLSGEELSRRGVTNVNQLQFQTPSLEVVPAFGGGQPQFRLRGVGFEDYATNNTPTVGVYVDEVAYPVPAMTQGSLFDIERVEVLRGPQGTLYGRNTTGGAINFISRKPTDQLSAGATVEYGRFDQLRVEGFISAPLTATLKFRLSGITEQGGGFQHDRDTGEELGNANRAYGRALLEWTPSPGVDVTLNVHGGRDKSEQTGLYLFQPYVTTILTGAGPTIPADTDHSHTGWGFSSAFLAKAGYGATAKPHRDNDSIGASLTAAVDLSSTVRLTSISAFDHLKRRELADWDASPSHASDVFWGSKVDVYSQEVRLSSANTDRFNWVAGAYGSYQTLNEQFLTDFTDSLGFYTDTSYRQTVASVSGFGQGDYKLTDKLHLIAGIRYEHEERKLRNFSTAIILPTVSFPTFLDGNRNQNLNAVTGKLALEYHFDPSVLLYASASRGVKSGGFTVYNSPNAGQIDAFNPETLYAYEAGFKADVARQLRINGSAFYYDYRNQQVLGTIIDPQVGQIGRITNAPKSEIYGGELEAELAPFSNVRLTQTIGYKFGRYLSFTDTDASSVFKNPVTGLYEGNIIDKSGQRLPIANWSYQGSASWTIPAGDYGLELQADYSFRDTLPSFLGVTYNLPERWLANATVTFAPKNQRWSIGLYGRNIFNERYDLTRNFFLPNAKIASPGLPSTYGVRAGFTF